MGMFILTLSIVLCLTFSFIFSSSETAITSLPKFRIRKIIEENKKYQKFYNRWLVSPQRILVTILVGNTIVNIAFSTLITLFLLSVFSKYVHQQLLETIAWIGGTLTLVVLSEFTPKLLARRYPEQVSLLFVPILSFVERVLAPLAIISDWLVGNVFSLYPKASPSPYLSKEELSLILQNIPQGSHAAHETETITMLRRAIALTVLEVKNIMTPLEKVDSVNILLPEEKFIDYIIESGHTRIPVYDNIPTKIMGYILVKDLLQYLKASDTLNSDGFTKKFITGKFLRQVLFIPYDKKVRDLLDDFRKNNAHIAVVNDFKTGVAIGIITLEDILEELVGEILDEYDTKKVG
ncbi:MAG: CNNM domain-containing protein [Elusimicrobiota bacterium]